MGFKDQNTELIASREETRKETEQMSSEWILMAKGSEHGKKPLQTASTGSAAMF